MLTLKHFMDRPTWAAAAGYQFNYFDCMSHAACAYDEILATLRGVLVNFPDTTISELPLMALVLIAAIAVVIVWPLMFWVFAFALWLQCKRYQRKYRVNMNEVARENIQIWIIQCERKWKDAV